MAKDKNRTEAHDIMARAIDDLAHDPAKLKEVLLLIRETEGRLTELELQQEEARGKLRELNTKVKGCREELRRVTKYGPDPQKGLPFAEGDEQPADLDPDSAAAVASYNKKKAKSADGTKKRTAKKKAAKGDDWPF